MANKNIAKSVLGSCTAREYVNSQIQTTKRVASSPEKTFTQKTEFGYTTAKINPVQKSEK